jgi:hypothetical protein
MGRREMLGLCLVIMGRSRLRRVRLGLVRIRGLEELSMVLLVLFVAPVMASFGVLLTLDSWRIYINRVFFFLA